MPIIIIIIVAIAIVAIRENFLSKNKPAGKNNIENATENTEERKTSEQRFITKEEVAKHNNKDDCWMIIRNKVYDVTPFIALGQHPPQIELGCGKEATKLFETKITETGEKIGSGKPHSEKAWKLLENYYLGELQQ